MNDLFDAHCHLKPDHRGGVQLPEPNQPAAIRGRLLCAVHPDEFDAVEKAAAGWPDTVPAFGVHPWWVTAKNGAARLDAVEAALRRSPAAWVGETGLDGIRTEQADMTTQDAAFRAQLELARHLARPVNLHCVKAWDPFLAALDEAYLKGETRPFIVHSFAGPYQFIPKLTERGAYFTVGPLAAGRNSRKARERATLLPEDRLLLESDAFLEPNRDDAAGLTASLAWLADVRGMTRDGMAARIAANGSGLFFPA